MGRRINGGVIGAVNDPTPNSSSGVWSSAEEFIASTKYIWPGSVPSPSSVEYLVVAGGGPGGANFGGGGGAGGAILSTKGVSPLTNYTVTIGAGGATATIGTNGSPSVFADATASGGGYGGDNRTGSSSTYFPGGSGGSGGGGVGDIATSQSGGTGVSGQGYAGGSSAAGNTSSTASGGGGGGGAGGAGVSATHTVGGSGGNGITTTILGSDQSSTTSLTIGTGSKSLTISTGLVYSANETVYLYNSVGNAMWGTVTSYDSATGVLVVNSSGSIGSGTFSSWSVKRAYAGGGAGGGYASFSAPAGVSGFGGGGTAVATSGVAGTAGIANSGGGGGGGAGGGTTNYAQGGSGVVIIAYPDTYADIKNIGVGLTYTKSITTRPGYKVYKFTAGTGTIQW